MKFGKLLGIAVAGLALVAGVLYALLRFTSFGSGWVHAAIDREGPDPQAMAVRFHQGPGPCLRYPSQPPPAAEVGQVVDRLARAGVTCDDLRAATPKLMLTALEAEVESHRARQGQELGEVMEERVSPLVRLVLRIKGVDLRRSFDLPLPPASVADEGWLPLSEARRQALTDAFRAMPEVFSEAGLPELAEAMNARTSRAGLEAASSERR